jgi:putative spermidine/putrescine transport system ATP-binding protein
MLETSRTGQEVELINLRKNFGSVIAVDNVSIVVQSGEFLTLLGPSGSGKSTTMMLIAGFELLNGGEIRIGEQTVNDVPSHQRNLGVVFQNYALFPHMTVLENIAYPLKARRWPYAAITEAVSRIMDKVRLTGLESRSPAQLSGGQQQRVALARALVFNPPVLLMDESLGALDKKLREQLQIEIKRLQKELGITVIAVTHDQSEALTMSDRIAVMNHGRIVQLGTPEELYERPTSRFVADFVGESNFFDCYVDTTDPFLLFTAAGLRIDLLAPQLPGSRLTVALRPEMVQVTGRPNDGAECVATQWHDGTVADTIYVGDVRRYTIRVGDMMVSAKVRAGIGPRFVAGDRVRVGWRTADLKALIEE